VNYRRHTKPLKAETPDTPSEPANKEQVTRRLLLLPTQTTQEIFYRHSAPFQVNPRGNPILQHPPSSEQSRWQGFAPPQLTIHRRILPSPNPPYLNIGRVD